jgi:hypothetical protein
MQQKNFLSIHRLVVMTCCALFVLTAASLVDGQSGRRLPNKSTSPEAPPPSQSQPPVTPPESKSESKEEKPRTPVMVVKYMSMISSSDIYSDIVVGGCLKKLQESPMIKVRPGKDMNRKEASDYAKASEDTYVVWVQLESDSGNRDGVGYVNPYGLYVDFVVFTPGTGKVKASGHVYQRRGSVGGSPLPGPRTAGGAEYSLRYAGEETGARVLDALGLPLMRRN